MQSRHPLSIAFVDCFDYIPKRERDEACRAFTKTELPILKYVVHALRVGAEDEVAYVDQ